MIGLAPAAVVTRERRGDEDHGHIAQRWRGDIAATPRLAEATPVASGTAPTPSAVLDGSAAVMSAWTAFSVASGG